MKVVIMAYETLLYLDVLETFRPSSYIVIKSIRSLLYKDIADIVILYLDPVDRCKWGDCCNYNANYIDGMYCEYHKSICKYCNGNKAIAYHQKRRKKIRYPDKNSIFICTYCICDYYLCSELIYKDEICKFHYEYGPPTGLFGLLMNKQEKKKKRLSINLITKPGNISPEIHSKL